ncbi:fungal specific transcription factor domain-containing protein [Colletotrichum asianum]|uniref:Fungal specific transcription factor domain-containing protein n=1 Tax=Colletotrichum asianum TaxID=702518 RepID=A0A8H3ZT24_9PEZI|nr:fungal specific transcription factor domain-containing protein [Colletotrichum asianum]
MLESHVQIVKQALGMTVVLIRNANGYLEQLQLAAFRTLQLKLKDTHLLHQRRPVQSTPGSIGFGVTGIDIHAREDGEYLYKRHLVEFIDQPELVKRPIDNKARMTYIGTDVSNVNYLVQQQFGAAVHTSEVCHYPTNRISRRAAGHDPVDRLPLDTFQLPPKAVVDELLEAYFRHVNPGFPVVDERIFMGQYRARDSSNPPSLLLLYAVLLVGAHALYEDDSEKRHLAKSTYFHRAKNLLDARFESNRDTIVQAALLLTWLTDGLEDATANAWYWLGIAVRVATGLGMHRDAESSTLVQHNKRMWRRVWWLLFQSDVWVSLQYGRPQSIHLEDSNVQKMKVSDFADCGPDAQPESLIQMSELAIIVSKAMRERNRASSDEARRIVLRKTDERLASWALRLPQSLNLHGALGAGVWNTNLHLHYNMALILLHRAPPKAPSRDE